MTTKSTPSRFGCLDKLSQEEPFFVLRGQDEHAADLVERWAIWAKSSGCHIDKVNEAFQIARDMRDWPKHKLPD